VTSQLGTGKSLTFFYSVYEAGWVRRPVCYAEEVRQLLAAQTLTDGDKKSDGWVRERLPATEKVT
jgi:hypothetical protein